MNTLRITKIKISLLIFAVLVSFQVFPHATWAHIACTNGYYDSWNYPDSPDQCSSWGTQAEAIFSATGPTTIGAGQSTSLYWAGDWNSASISGTNGYSLGGLSPSGGSTTVSPAVTTTYTLNAYGDSYGGSGDGYFPAVTSPVTYSVTITVVPFAPPFCSMSVSPGTVYGGGVQPATITWGAANATAFSIDHGLGPQNSGSLQVYPPGDTAIAPPSLYETTYTGTVTGQGGTATCSVGVYTTPLPPGQVFPPPPTYDTGTSRSCGSASLPGPGQGQACFTDMNNQTLCIDGGNFWSGVGSNGGAAASALVSQLNATGCGCSYSDLNNDDLYNFVISCPNIEQFKAETACSVQNSCHNKTTTGWTVHGSGCTATPDESTCVATPPTAAISISPTPTTGFGSGYPYQVTRSSTNATSCTVSYRYYGGAYTNATPSWINTGWGSATSGSNGDWTNSVPIQYQLVCSNANGTATAYATQTGPPTVTNVTISSPSVVANGSTQYTITVTGTDAAGGADIDREFALTNIDANVPNYRGYLAWDSRGATWVTPPAGIACAGGGIAQKFGDLNNHNAYGGGYLNLLSCTTSVTGNTRQTSFVVTFDPSFTTPQSGNLLSGYVESLSTGLGDGWRDFSTFSVTPPPAPVIAVTNVSINAANILPDGTTPYVITLTGSDTNGGASIGQEEVYVNGPGTPNNPGNDRGYFVRSNDPAWTWDSSTGSAPYITCTGGGVAQKYGALTNYASGLGAPYLNLLSCTTSTSGNTRTTSWTFTFNPVFTTPVANNSFDGQVTDISTGPPYAFTPWTKFGNFGLTLPAPTCSTFSATTPINLGQNTTVSWNCQNSTSCTEVSNADGFATGGAVSGSDSATPTVSNSGYGLSCTGPGGTQTFTSNPVTVVQPGATITANPVRVPAGSNSTISWSTTNVTACVEKGPGINAASKTNAGVSVPIAGQSTYTINCTSPFGPVGATTTVNVNGSTKVF